MNAASAAQGANSFFRPRRNRKVNEKKKMMKKYLLMII